MPLVLFDGTEYSWEDDISGSGSNMDGYSAGIVNRDYLSKFEDTKFINLDTVKNSNNKFEDNEISGFAYGIVSLGIGTLYQTEDNEYRRFYNENNVISGNIIHDVYRAGIVLGFEEDAKVENNRIYNIEGGLDAAGIMAGGFGRSNYDGYNNTGLTIDGNEISGVRAEDFVFGIRVEQDRVAFDAPGGGQVYFPDSPEATVVSNNVVRQLQSEAGDASMSSIALFTRRDMNQEDLWDIITTPDEADYFTRNDKVVNNTIIISDDESEGNDSPVSGIFLANTDEAEVYNNAIMFEGDDFSDESQATAAIFYMGLMPSRGGVSSDYNVYDLGDADATLFRFIETDDMSNVLEYGSRDEFKTLDQWRQWTGADANSLTGDFSGDLTYNGDRLAINGTPEGSILNNRGTRLDYVDNDINGNDRGAAGQKYDIGAFEFDGKMWVSDVEMISIPAPGAYRSGTGTFDDAEYIMTTAPVNIRTVIRNNGSLQQNDIDVYLKIFVEDPSDENAYLATPYFEETGKASVASTNNLEIMFNLSDNNGDQFIPETYAQFGSYDVPMQFSSMTGNVTPKYKVQISVESDQNNGNNIIEKELRFYLKKSALSLLVSSENTMYDIYNNDPQTTDWVGGVLNSDSLIYGLKGLGWYTEVATGRHEVDLFDREGWEERSVNYAMYRSMFWTDGGDDATLSRYQKLDLISFLEDNPTPEKRNLIIGSQDMVRELDNQANGINYDPEFAAEVLRAVNYDPSNPLGNGVSNDGNQVVGVAVGLGLTETISATAYDWNGNSDVDPYCGLMEVQPEGQGLADVAYEYVNHDAAPDNATLGVALTGLDRNVIMLGVDWRHWAAIDRVLRSVLDFVERNGGTIVAVELADFDAKASGRRVDLTWETSSELNSSMFEVEKADVTEAGISSFAKIAELSAAGTSSSPISYGPVQDYEVAYGSSYAYRLKMIDLDGKFDYSDVKVVTIGESEGISLGHAQPNPASDVAKFNLDVNGDQNLTIELYDAAGKLIQQIESGSFSGSEVVEINVRDLASGTYTVLLRSGSTMITRQLHVVR